MLSYALKINRLNLLCVEVRLACVARNEFARHFDVPSFEYTLRHISRVFFSFIIQEVVKKMFHTHPSLNLIISVSSGGCHSLQMADFSFRKPNS